MGITSLSSPPTAKKIPKEFLLHGDRRVDDYFWMKDKSSPDVLEYIRAENAYTESVMRHTATLQKKLFREMKGRLKEEDSTVPEKLGDYYYYSRTENGKEHPIYCRKHGDLDAAEEVILDVNEVAKDLEFCSLGYFKVSPDNRHLAYLIDDDGSERHTLFVKNLSTGTVLKERIENTAKVAWANDGRTLFYSVLDDEFRAYKVFSHVLGTDPKEDVEVFHERDHMFYYLVLRRTKSGRFITITVESATTSEVHYVSADRPTDEFRIIRPREHGVTYFAMDREDKWIIVTNEDAVNWKVVEASMSNPSPRNRKDIVAHREDVSIDVSDPNPWVEVFRDYLVLFERKNGLSGIRVVSLHDLSSHLIPLPQELCFVMPVESNDFDSTRMRFSYSTPVTPETIYDYDMKSRRLELRKAFEVPGYEPGKYSAQRIFAEAKDGTEIPIVLVHKKGLPKSRKTPCFLYGYGAYGDLEGAAPMFDQVRISLLDRGFVCAYAGIRGGGDMGERWHHEGRMLNKVNTFTDFIACAEHLVKHGYTSPSRIAINGRSAGGLLMGAVTNMRPDLFHVVVAEVPFVDAINSMLDDKMPLTAGEFEEWGNPKVKDFYDYYKTYSPYDNVERKDYPYMLITGGFNDTRVQYFEPLKWTAKLRELRTDENTMILRMDMVHGHSYLPGRYDSLREYAFIYAFILDKLGIKN